ncbi:MAG: ThuA domain-containing protein [Zavarzinella sp.]
MKTYLLSTFLCFCTTVLHAADTNVKILFLGDNAGHRPAERYRQLAPVLAKRGIDITYTDKVTALNSTTLNRYDGLLIYANINDITAEQETALLDYVASGKGFIPLHCGSFCFIRSQKYIDLVGAQFSRHGTGIFRVTPATTKHPIMENFQSFESWDETYVHSKHNDKDRTVLEYREEGGQKEPWTWIRTHGKGKVFYTAWGHDERTWAHSGFQNLVERGILWACGREIPAYAKYIDQPRLTGPVANADQFEYQNAKIPFYPGRGRDQRAPRQMQLPVSPEESMKHYQYPADFDLKLFASEPGLGGKPIAMNWDARGRLWLAVTVDYPNDLQAPGKGNDKIIICEDTNNDGKADQFKVFADKLSIPTSFTFAYDGIVVHQAPDTLFLRDTNGDDVADERNVLFTGWGTRDTHAGPSNLRYSLDGWYYGIVGYSGFNGRIAGEQVSMRQGLYRFQLTKERDRVRVSRFEFLRNTSNNSWGVGISEEGLVFGSTANGTPSVFLGMPNRYYEQVQGWSSSVLPNIAISNAFKPITTKVRQVDFHGGFTAAAGHALYTARAYPSYYWNRTAFVAEPTGHLCATFILEPKGADFIARNSWNLVAGQDEWISPIAAEVGPDGNMWVIDWYNFIVQHNPTPAGFENGRGNAYETELRDKKHGRIYRLVAAKTQLGNAPFPANPSNEQLVAGLKSDNMFWRLHAQRMLIERKATEEKVVAALNMLSLEDSVDAIGLNPAAMHAIWCLNYLQEPMVKWDAADWRAKLSNRAAGVRRAWLQTIPRTEGAAELLADMPALWNDRNLQTRLALFQTVAEMPSNISLGKRLVVAIHDVENQDDRNLLDALTAASAKHDLFFLQQLGNAKPTAKTTELVRLVAGHFARRKPGDDLNQVISQLDENGTGYVPVIISGISSSLGRNNTIKLNAPAEKRLVQLMTKAPVTMKSELIKLATVLGSTEFEKFTMEIAKELFAVVNNVEADEQATENAATQLVQMRSKDPQVVTAVLKRITFRSSPDMVSGLVRVLQQSQAPNLAGELLKNLPQWSPNSKTVGITMILTRPDLTTALLDELQAGNITMIDIPLALQQNLLSYPDAKVASRAREIMSKQGGLPNADRQQVINSHKKIIEHSGQTAIGKELFKKHCATCHRHQGEGNNIGPDLTGMAAHPKEELLIHLLDPSRSVEGNFRTYTISLLDGRIFSGMLASETKNSLEVIDAEAKRHLIQRDDIDVVKASNKSLMPEGFEKQMKPEEINHLLEFLTQKGRYLPLPLDKVATVVSTKGMFFAESSTLERLVFNDWKPKMFENVPFVLVDPEGDRKKNMILLYGPNGNNAPKMPKSVTLPVNSSAKTIHMLSGISGWGYPYSRAKSTTMIVEIVYADGQTEKHELLNAVHFADYIRREDVPESKFAFSLRSQQMRYLTVQPKKKDLIKEIRLVKGPDGSAPVVAAITVETYEK